MNRTWIRKTIIVLFWLLVWQLGSMAVGNSIILVGPGAMTRAFLNQSITADFWISIAFSLTRISLGFLGAFAGGILLGAAAYRIPLFKELLEPVMLLMRSIPVASFVILALIWMGSKNLALFIAFTIVLPVIYINTIAGLESTDKALLEMAQVFRIKGFQKLRYIYLPAILPYLVSASKIALGMSWKSGIAAEVIGVPSHSIGEKLYMSKIYLDTADLFAWTFVIMILSCIFEKLFLALLKRVR